MLKHILLGAMLLALVGCGCGDSGGGSTLPAIQPTTVRPSSQFPPCAIPAPNVTPNVCDVDVMFVLDDSLFMTAQNGMGVVPNNPNDNRSRSIVAQRIFQHLQTMLKTKVAAAQQAGTIPASLTFDFAFGVARYEDYGGATVQYLNQTGQIDAGARPYMLNMPLLRELHPSFATTFATALSASTNNNGNPTVQGFLRQDPQSGIEALFQLATGSGFDGNGDQDTLDNGAPCSADAQGLANPPTIFNDVPAVTYALAGQDPQDANRSVFNVLDENGGQGGCISSGSVGGAGWREGSKRFVILASDIATVAPFCDATGAPAAPAPGSAVQNDPNAPTEFVPSPAFDNVTGRYGPAQPPVAPLGAACVQQTVYALNNLGIETLLLGAPGVQPGQTKPNLPGANPTQEIEAIENPDSPAFTPFTWMSAMSILTGSRISDNSPGSPFPATRLFPAVFNLGNVGVFDPNNADAQVPAMAATNVTDDVVDGLVERLAKRIAANPPAPGGNGTFPPLPTLTLQFTLTMQDNAPGFLFNRVAPGANQVVTNVNVPVYYQDAANNTFIVDGAGNPVPFTPTPVTIAFDDFAYTLPESSPTPQTDNLAVTMTGAFLSIGNQVTTGPGVVGNETQVGQLQQKVADFSLNSQATLQVTVWPTSQTAPLPRGVMVMPGSHSGWCLTIQDLTWGAAQVFAPETFGSCAPSPLPQP